MTNNLAVTRELTEASQEIDLVWEPVTMAEQYLVSLAAYARSPELKTIEW